MPYRDDDREDRWRNWDEENRWQRMNRGDDWESEMRRAQKGNWERGEDRNPYDRGQVSGYDRDFRREPGYPGQWGRRSNARYYDRQDYTRSLGQPGYNRPAYPPNQGQYFDQDWEDELAFDPDPMVMYTESWWMVPGPFTGVGPRGYQRSDERIKEEICERMAQHGQLDPSEIEIEVQGGEVTLTGLVSSRREKRIAEDVAESVSGVSDVHNQVRIQSGGPMGPMGSRMTGQTAGDFRMTNTGRNQIRTGQPVVSREGVAIGQVKAVHGSDFVVGRQQGGDLSIPIDACLSTSGQIMLSVRADEVDQQGWSTSGPAAPAQAGREQNKGQVG